MAYYDFPTAGEAPFFEDDFFGNSSVDGVYLYNYELIELGADIGMNLFDMPLKVFANYVQNQDADDYDTGWLAGAQVGRASGSGTWQLAYQYQDLEADAVLGLLSDSDFAGGGTDGQGRTLKGGYAIAWNWNVNFTFFINEKDADVGNRHDYDRLQLDHAMKF